jgi:hypothetical protein
MKSLKYRIGIVSTIFIEFIALMSLIAYNLNFMVLLTPIGFDIVVIVIMVLLFISYGLFVMVIDQDVKENK